MLTTPETRRGWEQPRHPEPMGEGRERQETRTGATVEGVRAEARARHEAVGSVPGSAPAGPSPRPKTELRRVTIHEHDDRNGCETVRGVGFSWRCTCGGRGKVYASREMAALAKVAHEGEHGR